MEFYDRHEERTGVQEHAGYNPRNDMQSDFVMVYGLHDLKKRISDWKKQGYVIHLMTGVAWGEYQDYLYGKFDGIDHHDEGQVRRSGHEINHGKDVPYMVPSVAFSRYLTAKLKTAVDAGVEAIHLEEPELWASAGYSEAFKREWKIYYKEDWRDPEADADAQFKSSKLKQYLYTRMLDRLCSELKEYAYVKYRRMLRFYVPTHSLISYTQISMVSPESALIDLPGVDGYIAQIWTGTARISNTYEGIVRERTFETAFLEYGIMQELVRGTGRKMWYLHDPVEDDPKHTWKDYRYNYYRTVSASLMHPEISNYEVAPWPNRVFCGAYPTEDGSGREGMPEDYRTNLLTVMHALRDMKQPDTEWRNSRTEIGLLLADSAMFQRVSPDGDPRKAESRKLEWNPFYGLALPLLKHGLSVRPVQFDNIRRSVGYLDSYRALVLSYEFMKPEYPDVHNAISQWISAGGVLVYVGDGKDVFHKIKHWWNSGLCSYNNPAEHLFEACGLPADTGEGIYRVGRGTLCVINRYPADIAKDVHEAEHYRSMTEEAMATVGIEWIHSSEMIMDRGPYTVTAVLDETPFSRPCTLTGDYVDMYDVSLPVLHNPVLEVGSVGLYYNMAKLDRGAFCVPIAAAARLEKFTTTARSTTFKAICCADSQCKIRLYVKRQPISVTAALKGSAHSITAEYDADSSTLLLTFDNSTEGVDVKIKYCK